MFRADHGLVTVVYAGDKAEVAGWGRDYRARLVQALNGSETTRALIDGKQPVGQTMGLLKTRFFYRKPIGPGFALVGDAGHFKDFVTGQGMTDAFLDARRLSHAIVDGRPEAYEHFWRERDSATLPLHFDALRQGAIGYNNAFMRHVIGEVAKRAELRARLTQVLDRKLAPGDLVQTSTLLGLMGKALFRGKWDVISGFVRMGRELNAETRELAQRRALLGRSMRELAKVTFEPASQPSADLATVS